MRRLVTFGILLVTAQTALAQSESLDCPGLKPNASVEQQVLCWFERERSGAGGCATDNENAPSTCALQTVNWCTRASLDEAPVANACFLADLRIGQPEEALAVKRYIQTPTAEVTRCQQALEAITIRFVSDPVGAELLVDGQSHGKAPVEVALHGSWWKSNVVARFGAGESVTEVAVSRKELMAAFDRRACTMAEVAVRGPASALVQVSRLPAEEPRIDTRRGSSVPAVISLALGGAGLITGGILLGIAVSRRSDLESPEYKTPWTKELQDQGNSVKPLSTAGWVAIGAGAALAAVGVTLLAVSGGSSSERAADQTNLTVRLAGQGIACSGQF